MKTVFGPRHRKAGLLNRKQKMIDTALSEGFVINVITETGLVSLTQKTGTPATGVTTTNMVIEGPAWFPRSSSLTLMKGAGKFRHEA